ncbi:MAG: hypothetical protein AAF620_10825 [Bacteroidota bacterium]
MQLPSHLKDVSSKELSSPLISNLLHFIAELQEEIIDSNPKITFIKRPQRTTHHPSQESIGKKRGAKGRGKKTILFCYLID